MVSHRVIGCVISLTLNTRSDPGFSRLFGRKFWPMNPKATTVRSLQHSHGQQQYLHKKEPALRKFFLFWGSILFFQSAYWILQGKIIELYSVLPIECRRERYRQWGRFFVGWFHIACVTTTITTGVSSTLVYLYNPPASCYCDKGNLWVVDFTCVVFSVEQVPPESDSALFFPKARVLIASLHQPQRWSKHVNPIMSAKLSLELSQKCTETESIPVANRW